MTNAEMTAFDSQRPLDSRGPTGGETAFARLPFDPEASLDALFAQAVAAYADLPAARLDGDALTYRELDRAANALAGKLREAGVREGDVVGLLTHRSLQSVIGMVAIIKAGGVLMPLDADYPLDRLAFLLEDAAPSAVLVHPDCAAIARTLSGYAGALIDFDAPLDPSARTDAPPATAARTGADAAYLIYTSGSTGRPKGVLCTHRGIAGLALADDIATHWPGSVTLHVISLSFDPNQWEVWGTLLNGGCLAILPDPTPSLDRIADAIQRYGVTFTILPTGMFHLMVDHRLDGLKPLKVLVVGGDVMSPTHAVKALAALPGTRILNAYGPTENAVATTRYLLPAGWTGEAVPIGPALPHTTVHVLDENLSPVAPGAIGELVTGGWGVALGYLNQPELTAEKFVADPFSDAPGARMYRTGDLVRIDADGLVEFHGRVDRQVKINGKRVELDEIENGLREDAALADAVIALHDAGNDVKRIVAYLKPAQLTPEAEHAGLAQEVINRFKERFPAHMIPADVVVMNVFPLTSAGKVDRKKLPAPKTGPASVPQTDRNAPGVISSTNSTTEQTIADIWRRVLKVDHIGLDDNFFDLGGTSILLVRVHAQIQERLNSNVELVTLFDKPKVRDLAAYLSADDAGGPSSENAAAQAARADKRSEALARARQMRARPKRG